ncbi:MAG: ABC transporter ATP-binding protein, partial [Pseudomonadota bacterium]
MSPLITLDAVEKSFGNYHALRGISAEIGAGEFFSLLGPSGCGKTTLLRAIAGFEPPSSGTITIAGRDMAGVPPNKRPTNMVFQSYAIFPHLSVAENVAFGLRRLGLNPDERHRRVGEALEMVGLGDLGARAAHALSGGQRQRVALARALILKPQVLLLDEPLSALDKALRGHMQAELRRLQRQVGITFILVTHDQDEALSMSDRIAVMFEGQIAQIAPPTELYRRPKSRQVGAFVGRMSFVPARHLGAGRCAVEGLGEVTLSESQAPDGFDETGVIAIRPEVLRVLAPGEGAGKAHLTQAQVEERA